MYQMKKHHFGDLFALGFPSFFVFCRFSFATFARPPDQEPARLTQCMTDVAQVLHGDIVFRRAQRVFAGLPNTTG